MKRLFYLLLLAAGLAASGCSHCEPNGVCYGPLGRPYYEPQRAGCGCAPTYAPTAACAPVCQPGCAPVATTCAPVATSCVPVTAACPPGTIPTAPALQQR